MDVLPHHFRCLQYCGLWHESYQHFWLIKTIYKALTAFLIFQFTLFGLIELATAQGQDLADLTECLFFNLSYVALCCKIFNFIFRRESMVVLLNAFRSNICHAKTLEEKNILSNYDNYIKKIFTLYLSLLVSTMIALLILPFIKSRSYVPSDLPFRQYLPYSVEGPISYFVTYIVQSVSASLGVFVDVALDTVLPGFILLICGQFEMCCYRITRNENEDTETMRNYFVHHVFLQDLIKKIKSFFAVLLPLCLLNLIALCTSLFQMPQQRIFSAEFWTLFMYLGCLLSQIFLFCWFGNELNLKSQTVAEAIYNSNWIFLKPQQRRNYLFVLFKSQRESIISFYGQCSLSLQTYCWILKTSYGIFNLLQKVSFDK